MGEGQKITLVLSSIIFLSHICWTWGQGAFVNRYSSTYGNLCNDACSMRDNDYYWCNTYNGWDYCSVQEDTDFKGIKCRDDHPCNLMTEKISSCKNTDGKFSHCGKVEERAQQYISAINQMVCHGECFYNSELRLSYCKTDKDADFCSPIPDVTYKNVPCRSDHPCGTYGESYSWCYTASSWDYCGLIKSNECRYATRWEKESCMNALLICSQSNSKQIKLFAVSNSAIGDAGLLVFEITELFSRWNSRSGIATTDKHHIQLQGTVNKNNQVYKKIEIQQNTRSTILGQALIPQNENIPDRFIRMALVESLKHRATVVVGVSRGASTFQGDPNCN